MSKRAIDGFFSPKTVVILGASTVENSTGWAMARQAKTTFNNTGLYFVNPKGGELFGLPLYKTVGDIPIPQVDLAILAIKAEFTPKSVEDLALKKGCFYQVVVSGGFSEIGEAGKKLQDELIQLSEKHNIRIIGPNCVGIYSPSDGVDCLFIEGKNAERTKTGYVSLASHSGGFGMVMFNELNDYGRSLPWFGRILSLGNSCNVNEADMMNFFEKDPQTHVCTFYLEGLRNSRYFLESAKRSVLKGKSVLITKAGRNAAGAHALSSHSASLAADDFVTDELFSQYGIMRTEGWRDMYRVYTLAFAFGRPFRTLTGPSVLTLPQAATSLPGAHPRVGNRVFIVTNGGGQGVQLADALSRNGLSLAKAKLELFKPLNFPSFFIVSNPVDLTGGGNSDHFAKVLKLVYDDDEVDAVVLNVVTVLSQIHGKQLEEIADFIISLAGASEAEKKTGCFSALEAEYTYALSASASSSSFPNVLPPGKKPIFVNMIGADKVDKANVKEKLLANGIPYFDSEVDCAQAVAASYKFQVYRQKELDGIIAQNRLASAASSFFTATVKDQISKLLAKVPKPTPPSSSGSSGSASAAPTSQALHEHDACSILDLVGVPVQRYILATTGAEANAFYNTLVQTTPLAVPKVVVKIVSKDILHKSDEGGVIVGLGTGKKEEDATKGEIAQAVEGMINGFRSQKKDVTGVIVSEMVPPKYRPFAEWKTILASSSSSSSPSQGGITVSGVSVAAATWTADNLPKVAPSSKGIELIIGVNTDSTYGKVLLVGIGGVLVEVNKDVSIGACPLQHHTALQLLGRLKSQKLLDGYRGLPRVNRDKLADIMVRLSQLAVEFDKEIESFDFNPVIAGDNGEMWVVDARIMVRC